MRDAGSCASRSPRSGADVQPLVRRLLADAVARGALVAHADLLLGAAETPAAAEALRGVGFSIAGLLPEYRDEDVLRLQWLAASVEDARDIVLEGEGPRAVAAFVRDDFEAVRAGEPIAPARAAREARR